MRRFLAVVLCGVLLLCSASCAAEQTVSCPEAHLVLTVPDSWKVVPLYDTDDPELFLLLEDRDLALSVYVSDAGGGLPGIFELLTGDETESGTVVFNDMEMNYVAGKNEDGDYTIYTWLYERDQVQLFFLITGEVDSARKVIKKVMNSIEFR